MKPLKLYLFLLLIMSQLNQSIAGENKKDYLITITTKFGEMKAILFDNTPMHKENFLKLAGEKYYDSLLFHRVINHFMIQTGDPASKGAAPGVQLGNGGPSYTIPAEFNPELFHEKGAISAARQGDNVNPNKESSGSQFYIVQGKTFDREELLRSRIDLSQLFKYFKLFIDKPENKDLKENIIRLQQEGKMDAVQSLIISKKDEIEKEYSIKLEKPLSEQQIQKYTTIGGAPHLDGGYTVFGKVIAGLDVIDRIAEVKTDSNNRPIEDVTVKISVEEMSKKKITKLYGYQYPEK
jgi:peptidyl-prolyl cis-trans isomerase B (cyclophilin B)